MTCAVRRGPPATLSRSSSGRPIPRPVNRSSQGGRHSSCSDNYPIDVEFGVIVDVEPSRSIRQVEVGAERTMIERTEDRFGLRPERLVADTACGAALAGGCCQPRHNGELHEQDKSR